MIADFKSDSGEMVSVARVSKITPPGPGVAFFLLDLDMPGEESCRTLLYPEIMDEMGVEEGCYIVSPHDLAKPSYTVTEAVFASFKPE